MSYWDKMDKKVWESSEVMKELEKIYKQSNLENLSKTINDLAQNAPKIQQATQNVKQLSDAVSKIGNPAEDGEIEPEESKECESEDSNSKRSHKKAKNTLLKELKKMADDAADRLDYKLAYKIERAIDSVVFEDLEE